MQKGIICCISVALFFACKQTHKEPMTEPVKQLEYTEPYRPQFHFSPQEKWMNDPNGLVYHDGIYHLFYQYYPDDIVWGPMHWGHATSKDMVHWEHRPIALYPDEHGLIFSGSAVVDMDNTSGFGENGKTPLVAIFTYHSMEGEKAGRNDFQTQGIAYSLDNGTTWEKYADNPVIGNDGIKDFRDPKVFWHKDTQSWIMALVAGDHAKFYRSKNLKDWEHSGDFGKLQGTHGGVWECPDLFPLQVEGTDEEKWVLIISINPGAPNGGSGTQYFIGDFDGERFVSEQKEPKWLDHGTDNYAGVTYNNTPNGERIFIGWMSNWDYARDTPTEKWRSAMTIPRKLSLRKAQNEYVLANYPLEQVDALAKSELAKEMEIAAANSDTLKIEGLNQSHLVLKTASRDFRLLFKNDLDEVLELKMDGDSGTFIVDRRKSGKVSFQKEFGNKEHFMPIALLGEDPYEMKILVDWSSIEIFLDGGLLAMTEQVFPTVPYNTLVVENGDETSEIQLEAIKKMNSIWQPNE